MLGTRYTSTAGTLIGGLAEGLAVTGRFEWHRFDDRFVMERRFMNVWRWKLSSTEVDRREKKASELVANH